MLYVAEEGEQEEDAGQDIGAADDRGDRFAVYRVHREEQGCGDVSWMRQQVAA